MSCRRPHFAQSLPTSQTCSVLMQASMSCAISERRAESLKLLRASRCFICLAIRLCWRQTTERSSSKGCRILRFSMAPQLSLKLKKMQRRSIARESKLDWRTLEISQRMPSRFLRVNWSLSRIMSLLSLNSVWLITCRVSTSMRLIARVLTPWT